jgi:hypothetical protein
MTSLIQSSFSTAQTGAARLESAASSSRNLAERFDSAKGLSAVLLAAIVSALVVAADQLVDNWGDEHLLAAWATVWAVGFAAMALFAGSARRVAGRIVLSLDAWSLRQARARADQRLWATALRDPRIMADLQVAMGRNAEADATVVVEEKAPVSGRLGRAALAAFDRLDAQAYAAAQYRLSAHL